MGGGWSCPLNDQKWPTAGSQIYIGALFLCLDDLGVPRGAGRRRSEQHHDFVTQVVPIMSFHHRERTEGSEVELLAVRVVQIIGAC